MSTACVYPKWIEERLAAHQRKQRLAEARILNWQPTSAKTWKPELGPERYLVKVRGQHANSSVS